MSHVVAGLLSGVAFGAASVAMMLPLPFADKRAALFAAFANRLGIGMVIGCVQLFAWPGWSVGLLFGLLLSLPDAIITKAYAPILVVGGIGGLLIGGFIHGWVPAT